MMLEAMVNTKRVEITLALAARLPTIYAQRDYVDAGALMSSGPDFPNLWQRAAEYVDKILRGAKPADIPVEQPTKFELVVNLTTARALGLSVLLSVSSIPNRKINIRGLRFHLYWKAKLLNLI